MNKIERIKFFVVAYFIAFTSLAVSNIVMLPVPAIALEPDYKGKCQAEQLDVSNCGIVAYIVLLINIMTSLVGIVITIMIAWGGIQYSTSRDNPQATAAAKGKIIQALIALVLYIFMWSLLQYLIPGGVL